MRPNPWRVSAFRNCFGTIWSVSTLTRSSGATIPVCVLNGSMYLVSQNLEILDLVKSRPIDLALFFRCVARVGRKQTVRNAAAGLRFFADGKLHQIHFESFPVCKRYAKSFPHMFLQQSARIDGHSWSLHG